MDVLLVGEIRDKEMVKMVIEVVLIGYLVLIILYINDVVGAIVCFDEMGVEFFMVLVFLLGVVV